MEDPKKGTMIDVGTSQLLSVPYALHAKTAETALGSISESDPLFIAWDKSTGISITESQISDLGAYVETETNPVFENWDRSTGISITSSQVSDFHNTVEINSAVLANTAKNSYPDVDKNKLGGIAEGAEVNVNADWEATEGDAMILNKPILSDVATSGNYEDLEGTPDLSVYATFGFS